MKILVASKNKKKLTELEQILSDVLSDFELISLNEFPEIEAPEENGKTFLENAIIKAKYYSAKTNLPTIADDSGLMVFALDFRPGVYSARYGEGLSDPEKCKMLLNEMKEFENPEERKARFVSAVVFVKPDGSSLFTIGTCDGYITKELRGTNGFGFDPIFMPEGYDKTYAELPPEIKNKISHRAKSLNELAKYIPDFLGQK